MNICTPETPESLLEPGPWTEDRWREYWTQPGRRPRFSCENPRASGFLIRSEWRDGRPISIQIRKERQFGDLGPELVRDGERWGEWWLRPKDAEIISRPPALRNGVRLETTATQITEIHPNGKPLLGACVADMLVDSAGEYVYPKLAKRRKANRRLVEKLQEAKRAEAKPVPRVSATGHHYWEEDRNEQVDSYQPMIGRIVSIAVRQGLPTNIERTDLQQRLSLELVKILDTYERKDGVPLEAYVWETLNLRLKTAINEENETDGMTWKPEGVKRAFQLFAEVRDIECAGRRATTHSPDEYSGYSPTVLMRIGRHVYRRQNGRFNEACVPISAGHHPPRCSPMISWGGLRYRELIRAMKLDVRSAKRLLDRNERRVVEMLLAGMGQAEAAEELEVSQPTISRMWADISERLQARLLGYARFNKRRIDP